TPLPGMPLPGADDDPKTAEETWLVELRRSAARQPTLVTLDQVESANSRVLRFLQRVARETKAPPLRVVAALRPDEAQHPVLAKLLADTETILALRRVELGPLDVDGIRALAERAAGGTVSQGRVAWLHKASEGDPQLAEALLVEGAWEKGGRATRQFTLDRAVAVRLEQMSPSGVAWLRALSVLSGAAAEPLLAKLAELEPGIAREASAEASAAGLAYLVDHRWRPASRVLCAHVIDGMESGPKRDLHLRAAELVTESPEDVLPDPFRLARLWSGAGETERSIECSLEAADLSNRHEPLQSARHIREVLKLLPRRDPRRLEFRRRQATAYRAANLPHSAARAYGAALALAPNDEDRADLLARQAAMLVQTGRFRRARAVAEEALALARQAGLPAVAAQAKRAIGIELARRGEQHEGLRYLEEAVEEFATAGDLMAQAKAVQALAMCEINIGHPDCGLHFRQALGLFERIDEPGQGLLNRVGLAALEERAGRFEIAQKQLEDAKRTAVNYGNLMMESLVTITLARTYYLQGKYTDALRESREGEDQALHFGDYRSICVARTARSESLVCCGRPGEAAALMESTLAGPIQQVDASFVDYLRLSFAGARMDGPTPDPAWIRNTIQRCLERSRQYNDPEVLLWSLMMELRRRDRFNGEPLEPILEEFTEVVARGGSWAQPFYMIGAELARAAAWLSRDRFEEAAEAAAKAEEMSRECELPAQAAEACSLLSEALRRVDDIGGAAAAHERGRQSLNHAASRIDDPDLRAGFIGRSIYARLRQPISLASSAMSRRLVALYDMIRALNSESDPEALLESILDMALEVVNAERGMILLRGGPDGGFSVRLARNLEKETVEDAEAFSRSVVAQASSGKPVLAVDTGQDERLRDYKSVSMYGIRSVLCVPLRSRDKIIGAVYLDSRVEGALFTSDDLKFLEAFSGHAALALHNAQIRKRLERENLRLQHVA
ncbi:MAG: GAF domain-containing protein, partial [Paracoccaceae bacterium]|nr:GAF domain-containing protein [Paracoccaceae bacterium]